VKMPHIHVHLHNGKVTQDTKDEGTSEGAKKAWLKRKHGGGGKTQTPPAAKARPSSGQYEESPHTHVTGQRATSGQGFYEMMRKNTHGTKQQFPEFHTLSPEAKAKWHQVAFEQEKGMFNALARYAKKPAYYPEAEKQRTANLKEKRRNMKPRDSADAGTSEGAKKAALTRKQHGSNNNVRLNAPAKPGSTKLSPHEAGNQIHYIPNSVKKNVGKTTPSPKTTTPSPKTTTPSPKTTTPSQKQQLLLYLKPIQSLALLVGLHLE
jgi:hypothetical protein